MKKASVSPDSNETKESDKQSNYMSIHPRRCFCAASNEFQLLSVDFCQMEMRILAHLSEDAGLISSFYECDKNEKGDFFRQLAASWFHSDGFQAPQVDKVSDDERFVTKNICYALLYGAGSAYISQQVAGKQINLDSFRTAETSEFTSVGTLLKEDFLKRHPKIKSYLESVGKSFREQGFIESIFGRRRFLPTNARDGQAVSSIMQSSSSDIMKLAMVNLFEKISSINDTCEEEEIRIVLEIHDELILEVKKNRIEEVKTIILDCFQGSLPKFKVPLKVKMNVSDRWDTL